MASVEILAGNPDNTPIYQEEILRSIQLFAKDKFFFKKDKPKLESVAEYTSPRFLQDSNILGKHKDWVLYTYQYDEMVNYALRKEKKLSQRLSNIILDLINIIEETSPIDHDLVLFRGIKASDAFSPGQWVNGQKISDLGFASKTMSFQVALDFLEEGQECCILMMLYPDSSKHIYINPKYGYAELANEYELLSYPAESFVVFDKFKARVTIEGRSRVVTIIVLEYVGNVYSSLDDMIDDVVTRTDPNIDVILENNITLAQTTLRRLARDGETEVMLSSLDKDELGKGLAKVGSHPNIYPILEQGEENEKVLLEKFFYLNNPVKAYIIADISNFLNLISENLRNVTFSYEENNVVITTSLPLEEEKILQETKGKRRVNPDLIQRKLDRASKQLFRDLRSKLLSGSLRQVTINGEKVAYPEIEQIDVGLMQW